MIKISQITKSYNGRCVLDIPEFVFEQGGKYALIGANGSGKSTLLKILAATLQPDSGSIEYQPQQLKEQMGYMPQKPYIYDFSVLKNILIAFNHSEPNQEKAISALQRVGMEDFASARGSRLSGGESQRVAFARMLVEPHPLLLLDEPTSAMDLNASDQVEQELMAYCAAHQTTLIFATHSLAQAQRVADILLLMDHGHLAETGTAQELIHRPQTQEARDFLRNWKVE